MVQALPQKPHKRALRTALAVLLDLILAAGILLSVYHFNYMVPYKFDTAGAALDNALLETTRTGLSSADSPIVYGRTSLLGADSASPGGAAAQGSGAAGIPSALGGKFADKFSDKVISTADSYRSRDLSITVTPHQTGSGENAVAYYVADVYTSDINCFKTYFGQDTYGTGYTEHLTDMSRDVQAVLAMNGDSYCYNRQHTAGVLIRNGTLYRAEPTASDVCILYKNGEMKTYSPDQFDLQQIMRDGAYQSWTFGPKLLDSQGNAMTTFNTWDYIRKAHPRSAIGYYEPGHYCFVVVDGRQAGYSNGMTLPELAKVFEDLGCSAAYNLDGGHSTFMTMNGQVVNRPYKSSNKIADCLYFGEAQ